MKKLSLYITALLSLPCLLFAQDDTNREVTLEREYSPVIANAGKITQELETVDMKYDTHKVNYWLDASRSVYPSLTFSTLNAADPRFGQVSGNRGYARVALGYRWNTLADFGYSIVSNKQTRFDIDIHHLGTFGKKQYSRSTLDMRLEKGVNAVKIFGGVSLGFDHWNYYSLYQKDPVIGDNGILKADDFEYDWDKNKTWGSGLDKNRMWDFDFNFGVKNGDRSDVIYKVDLGYHLTNVEDKWVLDKQLTENAIYINGMAQWELPTGSIGFDSHLKHHFYNKYSPDRNLLPAKDDINSYLNAVPESWKDVLAIDQDHTGNTYFDLKVQPYYAYSGDQIWVHVGVNLDFAFGCRHNVGISPEVALEWQAMPSMLALYGTFTGSLGGHELASSLRKNHYASPFTVTSTKFNTYKPIDATVGLKIHPVNGLLLNVYGNYQHVIDKLFPVFGYINEGAEGWRNYGTSIPDGYTLQMFRMGLSARYEYSDKLRLEADVHYNFLKPKEVNRWPGIDEQQAWYTPAFEAKLALAWHITPKWTLQLDSYFATQSYALVATYGPDPLADPIPGQSVPYIGNYKGVKLGATYDINLGVTYKLNEHVAFFANATNIAYNKRMLFYGYEQQLTSFILGASFQF